MEIVKIYRRSMSNSSLTVNQHHKTSNKEFVVIYLISNIHNHPNFNDHHYFEENEGFIIFEQTFINTQETSIQIIFNLFPLCFLSVCLKLFYF